MDVFNQEPVFVQTHLQPKYKEINNRTRSLKKKSNVDQILNSPRVKLSLSETILLDGRDTEVAFAVFFALKKKNVDFPDKYYTIFDANGINPKKLIYKDAKKRHRELHSF